MFLAVLGIAATSLLAGAKSEHGEDADSGSRSEPHKSAADNSGNSSDEHAESQEHSGAEDTAAVKLPRAKRFFELHVESSRDDLTEIVIALTIDPDGLEDIRVSTPIVYWRAPDESVFAISLLPIGETSFAAKVYSVSGQSFAEGTHQIQASVLLRRMDNSLLAVYEQSIEIDLPSFELSPGKIELAIDNSERSESKDTGGGAKRFFIFAGLLTLMLGGAACLGFVLVQVGVIDPNKAQPWIDKFKKLARRKAKKGKGKALKVPKAQKSPAAPLPPGVMDDQPTIKIQAGENKKAEPSAPVVSVAEKDKASAESAEASVKETENLVTQAKKPPEPQAEESTAKTKEPPAQAKKPPEPQAEEPKAETKEPPAQAEKTPEPQVEEPKAETKEPPAQAEKPPEPQVEEPKAETKDPPAQAEKQSEPKAEASAEQAAEQPVQEAEASPAQAEEQPEKEAEEPKAKTEEQPAEEAKASTKQAEEQPAEEAEALAKQAEEPAEQEDLEEKVDLENASF